METYGSYLLFCKFKDQSCLNLSLNVNLQKGELISPQYGATIAVHTLRYFFFPGGFSYTYKISRDRLDVSDYTHNINALYSETSFQV